jgi:hypothetical protein
VNIPGGRFALCPAPLECGTNLVEYKGIEYSVIQLLEGGWRYEIRFGGGIGKSGVTAISRASAIKLAKYEIDRILKDRK